MSGRGHDDRALGGGPWELPEREERSSHLSDYLAMLRQRPLLFAVAFLAVCGAIFLRALFATPVFRSYSALQIEDPPASGGVLGDLQALDSRSTAETEIEILRSRTVALEAARRLEPGFCVVEENAHRPLERLLGSFVDRPAPLPLAVRTAAVAGAGTESYAFDCRGTGELVVERHRGRHRFGDVVETEEVEGFAPGAPFLAFGRRFVLEADGPLDGRRYRVLLRSAPALAAWVRRGVTVEEVGGRTGIIRLSFEAEDPRVAQAVAQALAESYLDFKSRQRRTNLDKALQFLGDELRAARGRLEASEEALDRFRSESGALLLSERATWIVETTSALELQRTEQQVVLAELERERDAEAEEPDEAAEGAGADPTAAALTQELVRREVERAGLIDAGFKKDHPRVRRVDVEMRSARERLAEIRRAALERRMERTRSRIEHLDKTIAGYRGEARALPEAERRITELTREVRASLEIYSFLVEKEQEARLARASTLASVRSIDAAFVPRARASPRLLLQGMLAAVAGLFAAVFLCFFAAYLDRSVRSVRALGERTGLPVYAAVPDFGRVRGRHGVKGLKGKLVARDRPASTLAEVYRTLLANLRCARLDRPIRTLALTSAVQNEGKTVTLANLAVTAATLGERVALVDADLRRPAVHEHFDLDAGPGLADLLRGVASREQVFRPSGVENLRVATAGTDIPEPGAMLYAARLGKLLEELSAQYDWVFVDMPPVLAVADPSAVLAHLDAVLLVVRYGTRSLDGALDARDQIRHVGGNLLGFVFNAVDVRREARAAYGYGYGGYGYGYGHRRSDGGDVPRGAGEGRER